MPTSYTDLLEFAKKNKNDLVCVAKTLVAWEWAALFPSGAGITPKSAEDVPSVLYASCGWRTILLKSLFNQIGIETRTVNFYDVPYQGGHTTAEIKINGKWMFFDPTFGLYFESIESGQPISIGEAREKWPNVRVKQSTLAGWQGQSLSIEGVELRNTYTEIKNNFLYRPHNEKYVVGGEVNTLFFGPNAAYYSGGSNEYIKNNSKWVRINDVENKNEWIYVEKNIIKIGLTVSENIKYDNGDRKFIEYDKANEKNWIRKVTHINGRSRVEKELFFFDSGSKLIIDYDPLNSHEYYGGFKFEVQQADGNIRRH